LGLQVIENRSPELLIFVKVFWRRHDRLAGHATSHHVSRTLPLSWLLRVRFRCTVHSTVLPPLCPELGHASDVSYHRCDLAAFWLLAVSATVQRMMYRPAQRAGPSPKSKPNQFPILIGFWRTFADPIVGAGTPVFIAALAATQLNTRIPARDNDSVVSGRVAGGHYWPPAL